MRQAFPAGRVFNVTMKKLKPSRQKGMTPAALLSHARRRAKKSHHTLGLMRLLRVASQAVVSRSPARRDPHHIRGHHQVDLVKQRCVGRHVRRDHGDAARSRLFAPFSLSRRGRAAHATSHIVSPERRWRRDADGVFTVRLSSKSADGRASRKRLSPPPRRDPWRAGPAAKGVYAARRVEPGPAYAAKPALTRRSRRAGVTGNADPFPSRGTSHWRRQAFATHCASRHARATHFPQRRNIAAATFGQFVDRIFTGGDETSIAAHHVAGRGLLHARWTRRAPRPRVGRLRAHQLTAIFGPPSRRRGNLRDGVTRVNPFSISAQGGAPSLRADHIARENTSSDRVTNRAFHPLRRNAMGRASRKDKAISSQGPLLGALPSRQTEIGHGNRFENSPLGPGIYRHLPGWQERRAQHHRERGEGRGRPVRPHKASSARSVMTLPVPVRSMFKGRQKTNGGAGSRPDIRASAVIMNMRRSGPSDDEGASWRYLLQYAPQFAMAPSRQDFATRPAVERDQGRRVMRRDGWPNDDRADPAKAGGPEKLTSPFPQETLLAGQANIGLM